jgi:hypothetical protein
MGVGKVLDDMSVSAGFSEEDGRILRETAAGFRKGLIVRMLDMEIRRMVEEAGVQSSVDDWTAGGA